MDRRTATRRPGGFLGFSVMWAGQVLSAVGIRMTNFAVAIWLWTETHSASAMALLTFCAFGATILCSPIAGALIDRWNRRLTIMLSDIGAAVITAGLLLLYVTNSVSVWHLYVANALTGSFLAFQLPAYQATIATMMEKGHFARANAMMALIRSAPQIAGPALAAALLSFTSIRWVLLVDTLSYLIAIGAVLLVAIPPIVKKAAGERRGMLRDSLFGFSYIARRPPLMGLLWLMFTISLIAAAGWVLLIPLVLTRTGNSAGEVGVVQTTGAIGGTVGALWLSSLRPTEHKMRRIIAGIFVLSVLGRVLYGLGDSVVVWSASLFFAWLSLPFIDGYNQAIWQQKVEPGVQGRVFAAGQFMENIALPIAIAISGPLADHVFEPGMRPGGALTPLFGGLVGSGPGAGLALMMVLTGFLGVLTGVAGLAIPLVRRMESLLPDHDAAVGRAPEPEPVDVPAAQPATAGE